MRSKAVVDLMLKIRELPIADNAKEGSRRIPVGNE
jgi:hypothetical protein